MKDPIAQGSRRGFYKCSSCGHEWSLAQRAEGKSCVCDGCNGTYVLAGERPSLFAAVSLIERPDGRFLCVWNRRYGGWSLPGGKVEEGESNQAAQARELYEETSLRTFSSALVYTAETSMSVDADRGRIVHLFSVVPDPAGTPRETEIGCPVTWLTREEFLRWSPFAAFYTKAFAVLDAAQQVKP